MHISYELARRQQPGGSSSSDPSPSLPNYIWVLVVLFLSMAVTCGICARRGHRRQFLQRQAVLNSQRPNLSSGRDPYAPPWAAFGRVSGDTAGLQPPPRARRRGSQASVTSLPVYMENPGVQEVVLLQRTVQKEEGGARVPPARQPSTGTDAMNAQSTGIVTTSQPITNTQTVPPVNDPVSLSYPPAPSSSPPPDFPSLSHSPTASRPVDAHHSPQ